MATNYDLLLASTLPAGSAQAVTPVYTGSLNASTAPASSGFGSFFSSLGSLLKPAVEAGAVIAVSKALQSGRTPDATSQQNPAVSSAVPVVVSNSGSAGVATLQSLLPWLLIGGVVLVGVAALRK